MADDPELLVRYCQDRSEAAFTELVGRHFNLVYFAALRQLGGDAHRARDVSQAVFTCLAVKAPALSRRVSIAGWLHNCTRFIAAREIRGERRRQARHAQAQTMMESNSGTSSQLDSDRLAPVIDQALHGLNGRDRELVLLRYYQENSFVEISAKLGLSADAARFRLERALARMRTALARRGIESTSAALASALASQGLAAAPADVAATMAGAALAAQAPAASGFLLPQILMTTFKMKVGIFIALAAAGIGILLVQDLRRERRISVLQQEVHGLQAEHQLLAAQVRPKATPMTAGTQLTLLHSKIAERQTRPADAQPGSSLGLRPGIKAASTATNAGLATPSASFETEIWANYTGNVDALAKMITLAPAVRDAADKVLANLPPDARAQFPTPESVMAMVIAQSFPPNFAGYQMTGDHQDESTPDHWLVQFQYQIGGGVTVNGHASLQNINGNWMVPVGAEAVPALNRLLAGAVGKTSTQ